MERRLENLWPKISKCKISRFIVVFGGSPLGGSLVTSLGQGSKSMDMIKFDKIKVKFVELFLLSVIDS